MPVFNEAEGISSFLKELNEYIPNAKFIVIDDCSTDRTKNVIETMISSKLLSINLYENEKNLGHGPSTVRGMKLASTDSKDWIITVDGDGQFLGEEIRDALIFAKKSGKDVFEGVRTRVNEPYFRQVVTFLTRVLVFLRCGERPKDANTPFRIYAPGVLEKVLYSMPEFSMIPNLRISIICRRLNLQIGSIRVCFIPRRGESVHGSTWGQKSLQMPSKRFITFCIKAAKEYLSADFGELSPR